jgi:hypothetical protein
MRSSGFVSFVPGVLISAVVILPILFAASVVFFLLIEKPCMNPEWPFLMARWIARRV